MPLLIEAKNLASRAIRTQTTGGKARVLNLGKSFLAKKDKGFIATVWNALSGAKNFLFTAIKTFAKTVISAKNIFLSLIATANQIFTFNFNASDADLQQIIKNQNIAIASAWGTAFGRTAGWLTGIAIGAGVAMVCPVIGGAALASGVVLALAPEALEEIAQGFGQAIGVTARAGATATLISTYINFRKLVKSIPLDKLEKILGPQRARAIKYEWGKQGGPSFTLSGKYEERLEKISSAEARAFTESFFDEAFDSFIEAGFIVAAEIDNAYEQSKQSNQQAFGPVRLVEITPDENNKNEKVILVGEEKLIRPQILSTISNHRLLHNRDVGQWVGNPVDDAIKAKFLNRKLVIVFRDKEAPPWRHGNKRCRQAIYSIPDTRTGLSWKDIKAAASAYMWGPYLITAKLDNGRNMQVYGADERSAEKKLKQLLALSTAKALKINGSKEVLVNARNKKPVTKMYPCFASVLVRARSRDAEGRTNLRGEVFDETVIKFDLYTKEAPEGLPPLNLV